jgi:hypothetical protein
MTKSNLDTATCFAVSAITTNTMTETTTTSKLDSSSRRMSSNHTNNTDKNNGNSPLIKTLSSSSSSSSSTGGGGVGVGATKDQIQQCDTYIATALTGNKTIQFLLERLEQLGCTPPNGFLSCQNCNGKPVSGGFGMLVQQKQNQQGQQQGQQQDHVQKNDDDDHHHPKSDEDGHELRQHYGSHRHRYRPDCTRSMEDIRDQLQQDQRGIIRLALQPEIYLCAEHVTGPQHAQTILAHELIHAIDYCRSDMDPLRNCLQLACTEIRAENLSGECNLQWELLRAKLDSFRGHGQDCVRRRAIDSVRANPNCTDRASLYVDAAMERCYADTFPFERHPNQR